MTDKRPLRRKIFAGIGVLAGLVLLGFEIARPLSATALERGFWLLVGVLLIALGLAELMSGSKRDL
jgi:hypothetical protein